MTILGAIIGGGKSRRFGSDKATALMNGVALIDHVYEALADQVYEVIVCGRQWRDVHSVPDLPEPDLGPLGGLNAALAYGLENGFDWVVTAPVDTLPLPANLLEILIPAPACIAEQRLIGAWPTSLAPMLDQHLADGQRSVRSWVDACGAKLIEQPNMEFININRLEDLNFVCESHELEFNPRANIG